MTGKQLMQLGKGSPAAQGCIPLNFEPTAPKLTYGDGWIAEFWYYTSEYKTQSVRNPQFYLALELPTGHPVKYSRLSKTGACIGQAPEILSKEFYEAQNAYLTRCAEAVEAGEPTQETLAELEKAWLEIQPKVLADWLTQNGKELKPVFHAEAKQPGAAPEPENLVEYWKREMTKAIRAGDSQSAKHAQQEMNKAAERQAKHH